MSSTILSTNYTQKELRLLAVTCYLVATKFEGIPDDSYFFSAEVAADVVKLGVTTFDVKACECRVMNALHWNFEEVFPSEVTVYLLQAQKLLYSDASTPVNLNLSTWVKEMIRELVKAGLEAYNDPKEFNLHGFRTALACMILVGKSAELGLLKNLFEFFLTQEETNKIHSQAELLCASLLQRARQDYKKEQASNCDSKLNADEEEVKVNRKVSQEDGRSVAKDAQNDSFECSTSCCTTSPKASKRARRPKRRSSTSKTSPFSYSNQSGSLSEGKIRPLSYRLRKAAPSEETWELVCGIVSPQPRTARRLQL